MFWWFYSKNKIIIRENRFNDSQYDQIIRDNQYEPQYASFPNSRSRFFIARLISRLLIFNYFKGAKFLKYVSY